MSEVMEILKRGMGRVFAREKTILAVMCRDWIEPYASWESHRIPVVVESDHERFTPGTRFDLGFVNTALRAGYQVVIIPDEKGAEAQ
jgi:hypothetical protein